MPSHSDLVEEMTRRSIPDWRRKYQHEEKTSTAATNTATPTTTKTTKTSNATTASSTTDTTNTTTSGSSSSSSTSPEPAKLKRRSPDVLFHKNVHPEQKQALDLHKKLPKARDNDFVRRSIPRPRVVHEYERVKTCENGQPSAKLVKVTTKVNKFFSVQKQEKRSFFEDENDQRPAKRQRTGAGVEQDDDLAYLFEDSVDETSTTSPTLAVPARKLAPIVKALPAPETPSAMQALLGIKPVPDTKAAPAPKPTSTTNKRAPTTKAAPRAPIFPHYADMTGRRVPSEEKENADAKSADRLPRFTRPLGVRGVAVVVKRDGKPTSAVREWSAKRDEEEKEALVTLINRKKAEAERVFGKEIERWVRGELKGSKPVLKNVETRVLREAKLLRHQLPDHLRRFLEKAQPGELYGGRR